MARSRGLLPALLAVGACLGGTPVQAQRAGAAVEVLSVSFTGADQLPAELLRTGIATVPTGCVSVALQPLCWLGLSRDRQYLDQAALAADVFRLRVAYYQHGYREARIALDTTRADGGVHVRFRIDEGRPVRVRALAIDGAEQLDRPLVRNLPTRADEPFSMIGFEATRDTLTQRLANRGYAAAEVLANYEIAADDPYTVDVEYQLLTGEVTRFGALEITGAERVSPSVVQRMLVFREGDLYSRQALLRSQRNLFGLEVFRHAEITTGRPAPGDTLVPVRVQVNEGDLHRVRVGTGLSTADFVNAEARWISRNFLGGARRLEVRGRVSNLLASELSTVPVFEDCTGIYCDVAGSVILDFSQPWLFGPLNTFGSGLFIERFTLPGVYVRTSRGGYASLRRTDGRSVLAAAYRPELTRLESDGDLIFCVNFVACEEREIDVLRSLQWLAPLTLSWTLDRSNSLFAPTEGVVVRLDGELAHAATGSDFGYARITGELSGYHDPFRGVVIASRLRAGVARTNEDNGSGLGLHPQKRFFAGGPNSVRGFAQYRLGPKLLTVNAARTLAAAVEQGGAGCSAQQINGGTCDAALLASDVRAHPDAFDVRPVGGAALLEGNIEVRFPVWAERLRGAVFTDFGQVWQTQRNVAFGDVAWTPGAGIRYFSPVGPIRIDVGYNFGGAERLPVITTEVCHQPAGATVCADIEPDRDYAAAELRNRRRLRTLQPVVWQPYRSFTDRLQFHFSIGQAF
jgi:outer membrane protein assembly factor BamA